MKIKCIKTQSLVITGFLFLACNAFSADKTISIEGNLRINITKSAIDTDNDAYEFMTNSPVCEKLLKTCEGWEVCKATVVVDENNTIKSVISAEKVKATKQTTKTITTEGEVVVGTLDSGVGDASFLTDSDIGNKIFKKCGSGDKCKGTVIVDNDNWIKSLISVENIGGNEPATIATYSSANYKPKPSFDCSKASTFTEKSICSDSNLSNLDNSLMSSYKKVYAAAKNKESLKNEQKSWLKNVRNKCQNNKCLEDAYNSRLSQLDKISQ